MVDTPRIFVALPVLNESSNIELLLDCLRLQEFSNFNLIVCVNQYEDWWHNPDKLQACHDNQKSIELLANSDFPNIHILDRSTKGKGWPRKKGGVGWARKTIMDYISGVANDNDIIVSVDADTYYPTDYLQSIIDVFSGNRSLVGLSVPYYHNLAGDKTDRLILRYEIYMRYYLLNMLRIKNPYAFTALGSAMAFPVWAYRKSGGLTPVAAGEDFYFLQKLVKLGKIGIWCSSVAYPSPRFSDRVTFGTGPALIKGNNGDWLSYPHYHYKFFDVVSETYSLFSELYTTKTETPMDEFLKDQTNSKLIWEPLRNNYKDSSNFVKACINKVDGLRILQFLRKKQTIITLSDEEIIRNYIIKFHNDSLDFLENFSYDDTYLNQLNQLRDFLFVEEMEIRKQIQINY